MTVFAFSDELFMFKNALLPTYLSTLEKDSISGYGVDVQGRNKCHDVDYHFFLF